MTTKSSIKTTDKALQEFVLRLGDNCLILGQRLSEWCGHAPALEEEVAMMNVGLDLIGQARNWLDLAAKIEDAGSDADQLAYRRDAHQFRNLLLVEQPNGNFADTLARQYFFDTWHCLTLEALCTSKRAEIAEIAAKSVKEARYHLRRSRDWIIRLGDGTELSHQYMQQAVDALWVYTGELFAMDDLEQELLKQGIAADQAAICDKWRAEVQATLSQATLRHPDPDAFMHSGGKQGVHSEKFGLLLAEMQFLQRAYPDATW